MRSGQSLSTSQKPIDPETGVCDIKQSFNQKIQEYFDKQTESWKPDLVELSIYNGEELVGVCRFDITRYIDIGARNEKVCMVSPEDQLTNNDSKIVLKGNSEVHADAYLIFRIFADTINTVTEDPAPVTKKRANTAAAQEKSPHKIEKQNSLEAKAATPNTESPTLQKKKSEQYTSEMFEELNQRVEAYKNLLELHDQQVQSLTEQVKQSEA